MTMSDISTKSTFHNSSHIAADECVGLLMGARDPTDTKVLRLYYECKNQTDFLEVFNELNKSLQIVKTKEIPLLIVLIGAFASMSVFGGFGNGLVVYTVCKNKHMRTARNVFITNLAISDLILCLFTQPLNVVRCMHNYVNWELGVTLCKIVNMFTGLNMFVSTLSITAIALDRFQAIVHPTRSSMSSLATAIALVSIWQIAAVMSSPLLLFADIAKNKLYETESKICSEITSEIYMKHAKAAYSLATLVAQYLVPLVIVSVAYFRIYVKLQNRMTTIKSSGSSNRSLVTEHQIARQLEEKRKQRKANILLVSISVIFALSWLPITLVNIIQDFHLLKVKEEMTGDYKKMNFEAAKNTSKLENDSTFRVLALQSIPLLLVLISACINPVLYGWLNENFRVEFVKIICLKKLYDRRTSFGQMFGSAKHQATNATVANNNNGNNSNCATRRQSEIDNNNKIQSIPLIVLTKDDSDVNTGDEKDVDVQIEVHHTEMSVNDESCNAEESSQQENTAVIVNV